MTGVCGAAGISGKQFHALAGVARTVLAKSGCKKMQEMAAISKRIG
jgi:hypothetical protein